MLICLCKLSRLVFALLILPRLSNYRLWKLCFVQYCVAYMYGTAIKLILIYQVWIFGYLRLAGCVYVVFFGLASKQCRQTDRQTNRQTDR